MKMKNFTKTGLILLMTFGIALMSFGQQIAAVNMNSPSNTNGKQTTRSFTTVNSLLETPILTRGAGAVDVSPTGTATMLANLTYSANKAEAITNNAYFEFSIEPKGGITVAVTRIDARLRGLANSPTAYQFRVSTDNSATFTDVGAEGTIPNLDAGTDITFNITGISVTAPAKATFRVYAWGGTTGITPSASSNSSFSIGKSTGASPNVLAVFGTLSGTLPVSLTNFTGKAELSTNKLTWTTASETNNSHFEILRSNNGTPSEIIGTVKGKGTTNQFSTYNFIDAKPLGSTNYYQLNQVDFDGKTSLSSIISVKSDGSQTTLSVDAPKNAYAVNCLINASNVQEGTLSIYDLNGKVLFTNKYLLNEGANTLVIPFNNNNGLYVCSLQTNGNNLVKKFLLNN